MMEKENSFLRGSSGPRVRGFFFKFCKNEKCGKRFRPTGKFQKFCSNCNRSNGLKKVKGGIDKNDGKKV